ncbi:MAG: pfs [Chitinophagaceae bacterium]|nr:pfs [Chitinophagaceae bacterium]
MSIAKLTGILAPMPEEIDILLQHMHVEEIYEAGKRKFYLGTIKGQNCVVSLSRIGKVASAVTAAMMIQHFKVDRMIVTGVAGGIAEEVNIGDIVIAQTCIQHDMDCRPLFPQFEAPLLGKARFECDAQLIADAKRSCEDFMQHELYDFVSKQHLDELGIHAPQVRVGTLVSGDQFIGTHEQLNKIKREIPDAYFVEMEGAAVAQVCYEYDVPLVVVRSISDKADAVAHVDFSNYIKEVARYYTWGLVEGMMGRGV